MTDDQRLEIFGGPTGRNKRILRQLEEDRRYSDAGLRQELFSTSLPLVEVSVRLHEAKK
jgi:hypothetical protein